MGASGAYQWQCPAPPDELLRTAAGGRNTALFDAVRKGAYRLPRGSGNGGVRRRWDALWVDFAVQANRMFPEPLGEREVSKTAASVSRWTWANPEFGRGGDGGRRDPAEQSKRGLLSGVVRRLRVRPRNARIVELHRRDGLGLRAIARIIEVSPSTVWRTVAGRPAGSGVFHEPITAPGGRMVWMERKSWEMTEVVKFPPPQTPTKAVTHSPYNNQKQLIQQKIEARSTTIRGPTGYAHRGELRGRRG